MKLTYAGLKESAPWAEKGYALPSYDPEAVSKKTRENPQWLHFGIGNIFRLFIGGLADTLLEKGCMDRGIICAETFDTEIVDKIYNPFDNLVLAVTLHEDGKRDKKVLGSLSEAIRARASEPSFERLKEVFRAPSLQMVSFTITEKGYALKDPRGEYLGYVKSDLEKGPSQVSGAMGIVCAMLYERFLAGAAPLALVSMDNVSKNGKKLRESILEVAGCWKEKGFVTEDFLAYVTDEKRVSFPWSMIDKITPRPSEDVCQMLTEDGVEDMAPVVTSVHTYIAPYANAEGPQYLVIEDNFPNGRPPLEEAGVYMTDRETVNKSERMKVTVCLNPIHTALCTYDCLLGYELFADGMKDKELDALARRLGYQEGLPMVDDPGILSPRAFLDELMEKRFPNPYLGDTSARICVDISQMVAIRFGETVKAYVAKGEDLSQLIAIPLAIAGWIRYLLGVDDEGKKMELSPDPMIPYMQEHLAGITLGKPESLTDQLRPVLSNTTIFGVDYYQVGLGEKIEGLIREEISGIGAVRRTLQKYLG